jgi:hypothetical protein
MGNTASDLRVICTAVLLSAIFLFPAIAPAQSASAPDGSIPDSEPKAPATAIKPPPRPEIVYVTDFFLDPTGIDKEKIIQREGRVRRGRKSDDDPVAKAKKLVAVLSQSIVDGLVGGGQKAVYLPGIEGNTKAFPPSGVVLPKAGWLVGGWFVKVDEGNRALEATVGFGAGSGQVEIEVVASDLAVNPSAPFLDIGSESKTKVRPGGLVFMNPFTMAAKFVLSKGATEKDVKQQGAAIAEKLVAYINTGSAEAK